MSQRLVAEPVITWNLFLTLFLVPLCVGLLGAWIKRQFEAKDRKDQEIESLKQAAITEWRTRFSDTQCAIKERLDDVVEKLSYKVDMDHCRAQEAEILRKLERLDDEVRHAR